MLNWRAMLAITVLLCASIAAKADQPNVIIIMTDDQGYGDFGATGNSVIETPNIDAMAARSASMTTFYVSPVCSPTRASLMTGRYNYRTRCIDTYVGRSMMEPDEVTLAEALKSGGYRTGLFGKWHLGDCYPMRPMDQGFDDAVYHRGGGLAQPADPPENDRRYTNPYLFRNGEKFQAEGYCTDVYFDYALEFIEENSTNEAPFFAYIATNAPHGPYHDVPEELRERYMAKNLEEIMIGAANDDERDKLARIAAMITNIDENVGRLFEKLGELDITENTLVMFLVDNGPNSRRYVGPFRGTKSGVHEGGIRSPLWIHWPARLGSDNTSDVPVAHIDLMPSILDMCGVDTPDTVTLDGRSFLPLLESGDAPWPERNIVIQSHRGDRPVRYHHFMIRDKRWKLVHPSGFGRENFEGSPRLELYDVVNDPGETNDQAEARPEIVARLKEAYDTWFDNVSSTRPDNYAPPRIIIGADAAPETLLTRQDWRDGTWRQESTGHWLVDVATAAPYDITVRGHEREEPATVELIVGESVIVKSKDPGAAECTFEAIHVQAGEQRIEARIHYGEDTWGAYQVHVARR